MRRVLTAAALIPIIVYVVLFANPWVFLGVVALVAFLCFREYDAIAASFGFGAPGIVGYGLGLAILLAGATPPAVWLLMTVTALVAAVLAMTSQDLSHALPRAALLCLGVVYIFGCWRCAIPIHETNRHWLMYALILNWVGDAGAYYIGRPFGRHKMAPRVSPKKSWEGAAASVVVSIAVAVPYLLYFIPGQKWLPIVLLTAAANIAGQVGDLAESAMKRGAGVKDSGGLLPGHGGFLDRVDSTLFALPVIYAYLCAAGLGQ
ncbi:MAG TPA: phosphatidate cytidylyltransferase [Verrucomicrobiae bacterium]|nr:phosphatidate cytidylyltransferase [Verrucomicrobiae bacterium]